LQSFNISRASATSIPSIHPPTPTKGLLKLPYKQNLKAIPEITAPANWRQLRPANAEADEHGQSCFQKFEPMSATTHNGKLQSWDIPIAVIG
jgi:hypothetical protein